MLDELKEYLRIDGSEDDLFLTSLISASKLYIANASGVTVDENNDLHKLAVNLLVAHWYENREVVKIGTITNDLSFSLSSILFQMKYCVGDTV